MAQRENFEQKLARLEQIVEKLENGDIELEKSLEEYKKGKLLAEELIKFLDEFENKVQIMSNEKDVV
jgi:exodeoxyribonuclease VII small subunit